MKLPTHDLGLSLNITPMRCAPKKVLKQHSKAELLTKKIFTTNAKNGEKGVKIQQSE